MWPIDWPKGENSADEAVLSGFAGHLLTYGSSWPFDDAKAYLANVQAAVEDFRAFYASEPGGDPRLEQARCVLKRIGVESEVLPFVLRSIQEHVKRSIARRSDSAR